LKWNGYIYSERRIKFIPYFSCHMLGSSAHPLFLHAKAEREYVIARFIINATL